MTEHGQQPEQNNAAKNNVCARATACFVVCVCVRARFCMYVHVFHILALNMASLQNNFTKLGVSVVPRQYSLATTYDLKQPGYIE